MNESEVIKKIGDVISLLQLLETVSNRFASGQPGLASDGTGEIPWPGIKITISSAKRMLEEVCLDIIAYDNTNVSSTQESSSDNSFSQPHNHLPNALLTTKKDFFAEDAGDLGFSAPSSIASRIRSVPKNPRLDGD